MDQPLDDTRRPSFTRPHRMLDVGHSQVPYWRFGEGPDIFFIHGWPLTGATFRAHIHALCDHFSCHVIDLPGTGQSVWSPTSKIGMAEHCDTAATVIDHLALQRYALYGHDSGAAICRALAARHGARIWALVMGNTEVPGHIPFMFKLLVAMGKIPGGLSGFRPVLKHRWLRHASLGFGSCFTDPTFSDGPFKALFIDPLLASRRALEGQLRLPRNLDLQLVEQLGEIHKQIQAPVQMIWGKDDPWFPVAGAREMAAQFPRGAELVELPGKLFVHEEYAAQFVALAMSFLAATAPR